MLKRGLLCFWWVGVLFLLFFFPMDRLQFTLVRNYAGLIISRVCLNAVMVTVLLLCA